MLGSGQLGRMFALAARAMGYRVHIFSPEEDPPAAQVADWETVASYHDLEAIQRFARQVDVVTFEFENIPFASTQAVAEITPVRPDGQVLHITQNRLREKNFLKQNGFPVTNFFAISDHEELLAASVAVGFPAIVKTADFGYDGKGQCKVNDAAELLTAWHRLNKQECILEAVVPFKAELSVVAARTLSGKFGAYPVFENSHSHHILDLSCCPGRVSLAVASQAQELARNILDRLEVVGVLTVEMFLTGTDELLVNELAPRTHNSGHLTIDASVTSQFEQQVRAVCDLPLGSMEMKSPAAMANLLGDLWKEGEPKWSMALQDPDIKLHLYGKSEARPGRKMGHLTAAAANVDAALAKVSRARAALL